MTQRTTQGQMIHPRRGDEVALYKLFNAARELIYVGIANDPMDRWASHAARWSWWSEVDSYEVEWHPSREAAETAENGYLQAITPPRYNFRGTNQRSSKAVASSALMAERSRAEADRRFTERTGRTMRDFAAAYTRELELGPLRGAITRAGVEFGLTSEEAARRVRMCRAWGLLQAAEE